MKRRLFLFGLPLFTKVAAAQPKQSPALTPEQLASLIDEIKTNGKCPIPSCGNQNDQIHATQRHEAGTFVETACDQCRVMFVQMVIP